MPLLIFLGVFLVAPLFAESPTDTMPENAALTHYLEGDLNTLAESIASKKKEIEALKAKSADLEAKRKATSGVGVVGRTADGDSAASVLAEGAYASTQVDLRRAQGELDALVRDREARTKELAAQQEAQDAIMALRQQVADLSAQSEQDAALSVLLSDDDSGAVDAAASSSNASDDLLASDNS